jgi:hypothetical protein
MSIDPISHNQGVGFPGRPTTIVQKISSYPDNVARYLSDYDGRLHPDYQQDSVVDSHDNASKINLQSSPDNSQIAICWPTYGARSVLHFIYQHQEPIHRVQVTGLKEGIKEGESYIEFVTNPGQKLNFFQELAPVGINQAALLQPNKPSSVRLTAFINSIEPAGANRMTKPLEGEQVNPNDYIGNATILRELPPQEFLELGFSPYEVEILINDSRFRMIAVLPSCAEMKGVQPAEIKVGDTYKIDFSLQGKVL